MTLEFWIAGIPKPQQRPRARSFVRGRLRQPGAKEKILTGVHVYEPKESKEWKQIVMGQLLDVAKLGHQFHGPVKMIATFYMPIPASMPKRIVKRIEDGYAVHHSKKPELDNLIKPIQDCLENVGILQNDSQIAHVEAWKQYSGWPGVMVKLTALDEKDKEA